MECYFRSVAEILRGRAKKRERERDTVYRKFHVRTLNLGLINFKLKISFVEQREEIKRG